MRIEPGYQDIARTPDDLGLFFWFGFLVHVKNLQSKVFKHMIFDFETNLEANVTFT